MTTTDPLFSGTYPTGIAYCDRSRETDGDYHRVAFLSFATLELRIDDSTSPLLPRIRQDAKRLQDARGDEYATSASGQTITLGYAMPE